MSIYDTMEELIEAGRKDEANSTLNAAILAMTDEQWEGMVTMLNMLNRHSDFRHITNDIQGLYVLMCMYIMSAQGVHASIQGNDEFKTGVVLRKCMRSLETTPMSALAQMAAELADGNNGKDE